MSIFGDLANPAINPSKALNIMKLHRAIEFSIHRITMCNFTW